MTETARPILDSVRILQTREVGRSVYEVCATAQALFDETAQAMVLQLDCFVRRFELTQPDLVLRPAWLPKRDSVRIRLSADEAPTAAKEIFDDWTEKVRRTIPSPSEWRSDINWLQAARPTADGRARA